MAVYRWLHNSAFKIRLEILTFLYFLGTERHSYFLSSIYRQEYNYSVALLFRNWFLFRP